MKDIPKFPAIIVTQKTGKEKLHRNKIPLPIDLLSFWQWSFSDLVNNTSRGILAEYIVASAVGSTGGTRVEWDAFDILTPEGIKVEVKSSAYIQTWSQKKLSPISFNIRPTKIFDSESNIYSTHRLRQSDVYVFCVLTHQDKETIDPLNLSQWDFYALATDTLNKLVAAQKNISLSSLKELKPLGTDYEGINETIKNVLGKRHHQESRKIK